jgi:hypothetical protein
MDKKLTQLIERAMNNGASGHLLNILHSAKRYSGILEAVVKAGSLSEVSRQVGVSHQAVQQWTVQGYVPLVRVTEIEALYGVPRSELMNPKYAAALAEPKFSEEA